MKYFLRPIFAAALAGLLVASASVPSDAARRTGHVRSFDGSWSVAIYTLRGDCPSSVRASLRIAGGRVQSEDSNYQLNGVVSASGATRVTVSAGGRSAFGSGRLSRNSGGGRWRTSSGECSGSWSASRRSSEW